MTTRHEFLDMLHEHLKPRGYLEIGVYQGASLQLVRRGTPAIGIDPTPILHGYFPGTTMVSRTTSDNYFEAGAPALEFLDLAFIDGMHLFEFALRDFMNVEKYSNPRTVVVFDDVLPRNQEEAAREMCPGDWTGDVWKVPKILKMYRPDLAVLLVDTYPTGTCVTFKLSQDNLGPELYDMAMTLGLEQWTHVPREVLERQEAISAQEALIEISTYLFTLDISPQED